MKKPENFTSNEAWSVLVGIVGVLSLIVMLRRAAALRRSLARREPRPTPTLGYERGPRWWNL